MPLDDSRGYDLLDRLAEEFADRLRRGERPAVDDYTQRYPELAAEIRELFPALIQVEQVEEFCQDRDEAATRTPPLAQVGDFRIIREIGHGGMGVVDEAEQISLGRRVALKVLLAQASRDPLALERFRREARASARLHHTNIVPVFEVGQEGEVRYYAMQFIQGQSLDAVLDERRRLRGRSPRGRGPRRAAAEQEPTHRAASGPRGAAAGLGLAQSLLTGRFDRVPTAVPTAGVTPESPDGPVPSGSVPPTTPDPSAVLGTLDRLGLVKFLAFHPDGARLAVADHDEAKVHLWDLALGTLSTNPGPRAVSCVRFSPDGTRLAALGYDGNVHLCDARTGDAGLVLRGFGSPPGSAGYTPRIAFSPDGSRIAANYSFGRSLNLWDLGPRSGLAAQPEADDLAGWLRRSRAGRAGRRRGRRGPARWRSRPRAAEDRPGRGRAPGRGRRGFDDHPGPEPRRGRVARAPRRVPRRPVRPLTPPCRAPSAPMDTDSPARVARLGADRRAASRDAKDPTRLLVARFQLEWHGQVIGQPERQRGKRLTHGQRVRPGLQTRPRPWRVRCALPAASGRIQRRRLGRQGRVGLAKERQQFGVKVEWAYRHDVNNRHRHILPEQCRALRHEGPPRLGTVFVAWADEFDGGHQAAFMLFVVNPHLVFILVRQVRGHFPGWSRRRPDRRGDAAFFFAAGRSNPCQLIFVEGCDIDLKIRSQMDARPGNVAGWELAGQGQDNHGWPLAVKLLPRPLLAQWRMKMIAQRHGSSSLQPLIVARMSRRMKGNRSPEPSRARGDAA